MKNLILIIFVIFVIFAVLTTVQTAAAQTDFTEIDKIKQIKLLESSSDDVRKILAGYEFYEDKKNFHHRFDGKDAQILVSYSKGDCSKILNGWNVPAWKATQINISLNKPYTARDLHYYLTTDSAKRAANKNFPSGFFGSPRHSRREAFRTEDFFMFYNKKLGILFNVVEGSVNGIRLVPDESNYSLLCKSSNETTESASENWFTQLLFARNFRNVE